MRRIGATASIGLGAAFVLLAFALPNVVYPRLLTMPADPGVTLVARAQNVTVLVPRAAAQGGTRIHDGQTVTQVRRLSGERREGAYPPREHERFYRNAVRTDVVGMGLLEAYVEGGSFDVSTGMATNCCGDYVATDAADDAGQPVEHDGILYKFPFRTERQDYPLWNETLRRAKPARFNGTERVEGLQTYRFVQVVAPTILRRETVPGQLLGLPAAPAVAADRIYSLHRTVWVEPHTGAVIKTAEQINHRLAAQGRQARVFAGTLVSTDETVKENVERYSGAALRLRFATQLGPIGCLIVGPILLLLGGSRIVADRRYEAEWEDGEWDDDDEPAPSVATV
jgi:hypothetical protein